jgi:hypothetical protein
MRTADRGPEAGPLLYPSDAALEIGNTKQEMIYSTDRRSQILSFDDHGRGSAQEQAACEIESARITHPPLLPSLKQEQQTIAIAEWSTAQGQERKTPAPPGRGEEPDTAFSASFRQH